MRPENILEKKRLLRRLLYFKLYESDAIRYCEPKVATISQIQSAFELFITKIAFVSKLSVLKSHSPENDNCTK
jgi:hypothetical protein